MFYDIEIHVRHFLKVDNTREMDDQFNDRVKYSVLNDEDLHFDWCLTSQFAVQTDIADNCHKKVAKKWLVIRRNSFAKNFTEKYIQTSRKGIQK